MSNPISQNYNLNLKTNVRYRAYQLSLTVIKFTSALPENPINKVISNQLLRSTTSIDSNLIEEKFSFSNKRLAIN